MKIPEVDLTRNEITVVEGIASYRYKANRGSGVTDQLMAKGINPIENERVALGAEVAVAKYLNVYWRPAWTPGIYSGADLYLEGYKVDVKFGRNGKFWIQGHSPPTDLYIGVAPGSRQWRYLIMGFVTYEEARIDQYHKPHDDKGAEAWVVPFVDMIPIDDVLVAVAHR